MAPDGNIQRFFMRSMRAAAMLDHLAGVPQQRGPKRLARIADYLEVSN